MEIAEIMEIVLLVICALIIVLVLMQSSKSDDPGAMMSGATTDLFKNRKERGSELVISRLTLSLGLLFVIISLLIPVLELI